MSDTIKAAANPALVNNIVDKMMNETPKLAEPTITPPSDTTVNLPGGIVLPSGEVLRTAEVRELTGRDEEAVSRAINTGKAILTLVDRATVKIGNQPADEKLMYNLLAGDRDALLLGIYKATFGKEVTIESFCPGCDDMKTVIIDIDEDIETKRLNDPIEDRIFTIEGKKGPIVVQLPTGAVQKELLDNAEKTAAELSSILLERIVLSINGQPVLGRSQVQNLNIVDRRAILDAVDEKVPGPKLQELNVDCPDCGGKVGVPISFGTLFRF